MIVHASIDENGNAKNGKSGDQTGKEVCTRNYYSKPWDYMLRYNDSETAQRVSDIARKLAYSNLVGYNQNSRNTLYKALKNNNFDVDAYVMSKVKTETDCSAFIYAVWCCAIPKLRSNSNAPTTSTIRAKFKKFGFTEYKGVDYTTKDNLLLPGDILLKEGKHVVMNISTGKDVGKNYGYNGIDYSLVFDHKYYADKYADLGKAGIKTKDQLFEHFFKFGMKEKRQAIASFNVSAYAAYHSDLRQAYGSHWELYYIHYIKYGHAENRKCV